MAWHDMSPWRRKQQKRSEGATYTQRIADVERSCRHGDIGLHEALIAAYTIGIEAGRANAVVQRIGEPHDTEVKS